MDLTDLQKQLEHIYEIRVDHDVADFLITDSEIASNLEGGTGRRVAPEKLLLFEHQGQMNLSLYLAPEVVEHLAGEPTTMWGASGAAFCLAVEGVSHFLCVAWRAGYDRSLTQMELELQAEVDKFIGLLSLPGMSNSGADSVGQVRHWLFSRARFAADLSPCEQVRYWKANYYAAIYCQQLEHRYFKSHDGAGLTRELRRFYRLDQKGKIAMIGRGCEGLPG